jgi:hypothetical protein
VKTNFDKAPPLAKMFNDGSIDKPNLKGDLMQANSHNQAIPETVITAMETAVNAQLEALADYATPLTADDRRDLLKTGRTWRQDMEHKGVYDR